MSNGKKVLLALSGGVDSALAAFLLQKEGYEVIAGFMKVWGESKNATGHCAWKDERRDALRVAAKLNIPFLTFDFENEYRAEVASYLFSEYESGRTPNPDVLCNDKVKFPLLWRAAQKLGCDFIATGHHVRKRNQSTVIASVASVAKQSREEKIASGLLRGFAALTTSRATPRNDMVAWQLCVGKDHEKDQSYFLHRVTQDDLAHTLFPIGEYTKTEVRAMARKYGLPTADKRSTRGLCFIGKVSMPTFLSQAIVMKPGPIFTTTGVHLGDHQGLAPFTIGQRHGFGGGGGTPYFVVEKKTEVNALVVGDENDPALYRNELRVTDVHWISDISSEYPFECAVRIRYRSALVSGFFERVPSDTKLADRPKQYHFIFRAREPLRAPAPGQFAVFYDGEVCLGGGVIV